MNYLIGLDIGTSSVKGVVVNETGDVISTSHGTFEYIKTENGGIEIDAEDFVTVCFDTIKELASKVDGKVLGLCASSASGNLLVLGKDNKPVTPIFNWQDTRATTEAKDVLGQIDTDELYRQTGWPFDYKTFPLALMCYVKKNTPEKIENCSMVCMSTEYLYYRLTGKWGISTSAGTPFYLIDQQSGKYISKLLDVLGIDDSKVPPIMPCGAVLGEVTNEASVLSGLEVGTKIVLGSFDHPSAARGVGVFEEGEMLFSCGTSWVGFFPVKDRDKAVDAKLLIDPFLSQKGGCWGTMVSVPSISERIKLYVERYIDCTNEKFAIMSSLAAKSANGADGLLLNLYDEPDDDKINRYSKENIARAIMEGTVNLLHEQINRVEKMGIKPESAVMVGGPSGDAAWPKLIEEICGIRVKVLHGANAGAVGAATLAAIGCGLFCDEKDAFENFNKE